MQFSILALASIGFSATCALAAPAPAAAALMPGDVVASIEKITAVSSETNDIFVSAEPGNIYVVIPNGVKNFQLIVQIATEDIDMLRNVGDPMFPEDGQKDICKAFTSFVKIHQNLLMTVIGKKGLLSNTPLTAAVATVLRALEGVVDELAFGIIALVPGCAEGANKDKDALDGTLADAIQAYTPSFPGFPPF